jgi:hypothetical protein
MSISWTQDGTPAKLKRFRRYLKEQGIRPSTLESYVDRAKKYLEFCDPNDPTPELANQFRSQLIERGLSASSINNYCFAVQNYHKRLGQPIKLLALKRSNMIPYFFDPNEFIKIFCIINNIMSLALANWQALQIFEMRKMYKIRPPCLSLDSFVDVPTHENALNRDGLRPRVKF